MSSRPIADDDLLLREVWRISSSTFELTSLSSPLLFTSVNLFRSASLALMY